MRTGCRILPGQPRDAASSLRHRRARQCHGGAGGGPWLQAAARHRRVEPGVPMPLHRFRLSCSSLVGLPFGLLWWREPESPCIVMSTAVSFNTGVGCLLAVPSARCRTRVWRRRWMQSASRRWSPALRRRCSSRLAVKPCWRSRGPLAAWGSLTPTVAVTRMGASLSVVAVVWRWARVSRGHPVMVCCALIVRVVVRVTVRVRVCIEWDTLVVPYD